MQKSLRGFTLLELLLVVGIAAILIIAGITTYSLVNKSNTINETTRLVNTILDKTRGLYSGQSNYGTGNVIEAALINTGSIPAKFFTGTNITTPYSTQTAAVDITGGGATGATAGTFDVALTVPPAYGAELGAAFDPNQSTEITQIIVCGTTVADGTAYNVATISTTCGNSTTVPATANLTIRSR